MEDDFSIFSFIDDLSPVRPVVSLHTTVTFDWNDFTDIQVFSSPRAKENADLSLLNRQHNPSPLKMAEGWPESCDATSNATERGMFSRPYVPVNDHQLAFGLFAPPSSEIELASNIFPTSSCDEAARRIVSTSSENKLASSTIAAIPWGEGHLEISECIPQPHVPINNHVVDTQPAGLIASTSSQNKFTSSIVPTSTCGKCHLGSAECIPKPCVPINSHRLAAGLIASVSSANKLASKIIPGTSCDEATRLIASSSTGNKLASNIIPTSSCGKDHLEIDEYIPKPYVPLNNHEPAAWSFASSSNENELASSISPTACYGHLGIVEYVSKPYVPINNHELALGLIASSSNDIKLASSMIATSFKDCVNKPSHEDTVLTSRKQIESHNLHVFSSKVIREPRLEGLGQESNITPYLARHKRGCNCKKSNCVKKYCQCYQVGVGCSINCRCESCKNSFGRKDGDRIHPPESLENGATSYASQTVVSNCETHQSGPTLLSTPLRMYIPLTELPFSHGNVELPRSSLPTVAPCLELHGGKHLGNLSAQKENVGVAWGDENGVPLVSHGHGSPSNKRILEFDCHDRTPSKRGSGGRMMLDCIPGFSSFTPNH